MDSRSQLLTVVDAYAALTRLAEATISNRVLKGGNRLRDFRARKTDIGANRIETALAWFDINWPAGASWPDGVPRPKAVSQSSNKDEAA